MSLLLKIRHSANHCATGKVERHLEVGLGMKPGVGYGGVWELRFLLRVHCGDRAVARHL